MSQSIPVSGKFLIAICAVKFRWIYNLKEFDLKYSNLYHGGILRKKIFLNFNCVKHNKMVRLQKLYSTAFFSLLLKIKFNSKIVHI